MHGWFQRMLLLASYHHMPRKESASVISAKDFERMFRQSQWVPSFEKEKKYSSIKIYIFSSPGNWEMSRGDARFIS